MTYIKITLPDLKTLKEQLKSNPEKLNFYKKYEIFQGQSESISYLLKQLNQE